MVGIRFALLRVMKRILIIILFFLFLSEISFAEIFKWVDGKGVVHFTDDILQVPEKYRSKTKKMELPEGIEETKGEGESTPKTKEEAYKDRLGRGEDYWKGRMEEWRNKLKDYQERLETLRIKYNDLTIKINDSKSTAERGNLRRERDQVKNEIDQYKIKIEEANNMINKKIPDEAELYKAKLEWLR
ncbi:MAG: hypothetical protein A2026_13795 [Deltaproteobacteria bacterium RBG_19FT_COMBO_46_12]|nr:MAG: hypothetical protein A2026_13795 [Deltaproteobacteria bacterium RBG_19FT_COMBO_46_12]